MSDFETNPVGTIARLKAAEKERDALAERLEAAYRSLGVSNDTIAEQDKEVAALAAHGEAGREAVEHARQWVPQHVWTRLWLWKEEAPTAAIARLKAEWQAEALLAAAPEMLDDRDRQRLERFASAVIRRQAEED